VQNKLYEAQYDDDLLTGRNM